MIRYVVATPIPAIPSVTELTYRVPEELEEALVPGLRIVVPLGNRKITALASARTDTAPEGVDCKDVDSLLDAEPIVPPDLLELAQWMAGYYCATLSDVLALALGRGLTAETHRFVSLEDAAAATSEREKRLCRLLAQAPKPQEPRHLARAMNVKSVDALLATLVRKGAIRIDSRLEEPKVKPRFETVVTVARIPKDAEHNALFGRAPRRLEIFDYLLGRPGRRGSMSELVEMFQAPQSPVKALEAAGVVKTTQVESYRQPDTAVERATPPELVPVQAEAVATVEAHLDEFAPVLLQGVTASGKTEIYLQLIRRVLDRGGSALVLVPEISLTHQLLARLTGRFGTTVAVLHSELSAGERWDQWRRLARGEARIAIGARSAVLAPLSKLGILIVDEEHDPSYKQDDGVRYNGRDTAVMRARLLGCPVVLGSATPSLESWNNAREGRYTRILMPERVTPAPKPFMEVVDLRGRDLVAHGGLSEHLANHLTRNFEAGNQSLLFLNRRGYAANLQCYGCGEIVECANCSVGLTLHATQRKLHCHHCDARSPVPDRCPSCSADSLISQGLGTQRLEATVRKLLPRARVARMDRDATATKGATGVILEDWKNKRFDILIGTQMITKGHDVPGVTLVGVVHADAGLSVPDFRAAERTAQLLAQVAGRAGRGDERGLCILQSYQPDHPAIQAAARDSYDAFCQAELEARSELAYPPTSRMVLLRLSGTDRAATERLALQAARILEPMIAAEPGASLRGPAPAMLERVKGRYRFKLQLRGPNGAPLRYAASVARARLMAASRNSGLRVAVDVDPYDTV